MENNRYVEIVFPEEELPSDRLQQIKILDVPVLSKDDKKQIETTISRVNELLASPVGDKINYVLDSLEELKKESEALRLSLQTEETNYRLEEVSRHIQAFLSSMETVSFSLKQMESLPERIDLSLAAEVSDEIKESRSRITEAQNSIDSLANSIGNARKDISEVRVLLTGNMSREEEIVNKIDSITERVASATESASAAMQSILESVEVSRNSITSTENRLEKAAETFEQGLGIIDTSIMTLSSAQKGLDIGTQTIGDAVAGMDAVAERLAETEKKIKSAVLALEEFKSVTDRRITASVTAMEEKTSGLQEAIDVLRGLSSEISGRGESIDTAAEHAEKISESINAGLGDLGSVKAAIEAALAAIESYGSNVTPFVVSAEKASSVLESTGPRIEEMISRFDSAQKHAAQSTKNMKAVQESFEETLSGTSKILEGAVKSVDHRTDDILNVMMSKARDFAYAVDKISGSIKQSEILHEDLESLAAVSSSYMKKMGNVSEKTDTMSGNIEKIKKDIENANVGIKKSSSAIDRAASNIQKRGFSEKELLSEIKNLNAHLIKYDDVETVVRLNEARKRLRKGVPKWLIAKKRSIERSLVEIEEEMGDVLILTSLRKMKMNAKNLAEATRISEKKLRKRLKKLLAENRVTKEQLGRYFVYGLK